MSLCEKLIQLFYKTATSNQKTKSLLTPVGATIFFILVLLFINVSFLLDKLLRFPNLLPAPLNIILSVPILTIGLFLNLWSILYFKKAKGTPVPFNPPQKLVTNGPYAYVRNPMLLGVFIILFGFGILFKSISGAFIFTPLFILLSVLWLKAIEEKELKMRFGKEYIEYKKKVPMFIPRLKTKNNKNYD